MITNRRQLAVSKVRLSELAEHLTDIDNRSAGLATEAERRSVNGVIRSLRREIAEYENLEGSKPAFIPVDSLRDVPKALIRARIAAGITQGELAERLGLAESAIQRYEAQSYRGARWERLVEISEAIGLPLVIGDDPGAPQASGGDDEASAATDSPAGTMASKALGQSAVRWLALPTGDRLTIDPPVIGLVAVIQSALELLNETGADVAALAERLGEEPLNKLLVDRHHVDDISYHLRGATFGRPRSRQRTSRRSPKDVIDAVNIIAQLLELEPSLLRSGVVQDARLRISDLRNDLASIEDRLTELGDTRYLSEVQLAGWINLEDKVKALNQVLNLLDHELYDAELSLKALL